VRATFSPVALQGYDDEVGVWLRLEGARDLRQGVATGETEDAVRRQHAWEQSSGGQGRHAACNCRVVHSRRCDVNAFELETIRKLALEGRLARSGGSHRDGDDALTPRLGQQPGYLRHRGADERRDLRLPLLLQVVQVGDPPQQLALLVNAVGSLDPHPQSGGRIEPLWTACKFLQQAAMVNVG
jgi:hypothetical protein